MKNRGLLCLLLLLLLATPVVCGGAEYIYKPNTTLSNLLKDGCLNAYDTVYLSGKSLEKNAYKYIRKDWVDYVGRGDVCIYSFIKWCNRFVGGNPEYVYFELLACGYVVDDATDLSESCHDCRMLSGSNICIDPYLYELSMNEYLEGRNIIVSTAWRFGVSAITIYLSAIIPYGKNFYKLTTSYQYVYKLSSDPPLNKNVKKSCEIIGRRFARNRGWYWFMDNYGTLSTIWPFHFELDSTSNIEIREIELNPTTELITLHTLFY